MMDLVVRAPRRPAPGETLVGSSFETFLGGKGFNQAIAAARSGAATAMVGALGDDDFGAQFRACLERDGIDATAVLTVAGGGGTGVGLPLVEESGENSIVIVPRANHELRPSDVRAARPVIEASRVLLLQLELPLDVVLEAAKVAHDAGVTVVLNPAPAVPDISGFAGLVDYVVPNEAEAAQLNGVEGIFDATKARGVVLTLGAEGALIAQGERVDRVASHPVTCVDSVGAGDAFCGALAAQLAAGAELSAAVTYANAAGALAVQTAGAEPSMPFATDIEQLQRG